MTLCFHMRSFIHSYIYLFIFGPLCVLSDRSSKMVFSVSSLYAVLTPPMAPSALNNLTIKKKWSYPNIHKSNNQLNVGGKSKQEFSVSSSSPSLYFSPPPAPPPSPLTPRPAGSRRNALVPIVTDMDSGDHHQQPSRLLDRGMSVTNGSSAKNYNRKHLIYIFLIVGMFIVVLVCKLLTRGKDK